jgi:hypothetical protein
VKSYKIVFRGISAERRGYGVGKAGGCRLTHGAFKVVIGFELPFLFLKQFQKNENIH